MDRAGHHENHPPGRLARAALVGWLVQPAYIAAELLIARASPPSYSLVDDTISRLGALDAPHHAWMNATFVVFGALLAAGALGARRVLPASRAASAGVALWALSGVATVAVGLAPVDQSAGLHYAAAAPLFAARPVGIALLAVAVAPEDRRLARASWGAAAVTLAGVVGFGIAQRTGGPVGALERLALWPGDLWFAAVAAAALGRTRRRSPLRSRAADAGPSS